MHFKGQLISKANCQAVDSPKQRMNEFAFFDLKSCYVVKSNALRSFFFGETTAWQFDFEIKWPLVPAHRRILLERTLEASSGDSVGTGHLHLDLR